MVAVGLLAVGWIGAVSDTEPAETAQIAVVLTLVVLGAQGGLCGSPGCAGGVDRRARPVGRSGDAAGAARQADGTRCWRSWSAGWCCHRCRRCWCEPGQRPAAGRPDAVGASWGVTAAAVLVCVGLAVPVVVAARRRPGQPDVVERGRRLPGVAPAAVLMLVYVIASAVGIVAAVAACWYAAIGLQHQPTGPPPGRGGGDCAVLVGCCAAVRALTVADPRRFGPFRDFTRPPRW